jgi:hypothetical protein
MPQITRRELLITGLAGLGGAMNGRRLSAQTLGAAAANPYVDSTIMDKLPFGAHSHMLQPWRSYGETVRASDFLRGIGVVFDPNQPLPDLVIEMAARCDIRHARFEISWSQVAWNDESTLTDDQRSQSLRHTLARCRANSIRPLICLNANHGMPCPSRVFTRAALGSAEAGARRLTLDSTNGLVINHSGLSNLTERWAAEVFVTGIEGHTVALSKPLPAGKTIEAGQPLTFATLKYEPFSVPGTERNAATLAGWLRYLDAVGDFVSSALGTGAETDKGFDLEIWNELSFGTKFLSINNYYDPQLYDYDESTIRDEIVNRTAEHVAADGARFSGVRLTNGFASTTPWPASSLQPERIVALSKHPYPPRLQFPQDEQRSTKNVDRQGRVTTYVPAYRAYFPEYYATAIQTETIVRDMGPRTDDIYGKKHGRFARRINGVTQPVGVWITEMGVNPREAGVADPAAASRVKMKSIVRSLMFFLNKGAERLYVYSACGGNVEYGIIDDRFIEYAMHHASYPSDDTPYLSSALVVLRRIVAQMRSGTEQSGEAIRTLNFATSENPGSALQIPGDAALNIAPLRNIDALVLLPYQVHRSKFVIAYYVMTKDVRTDMTPEEMSVDILGINGIRAAVNSYDPVRDEWGLPRVDGKKQNGLTVNLLVSDTPQLLVVSD